MVRETLHTDCDIVVVGGGPAGLIAAWSAARAGRRVQLHEAAPILGGMAASIDVAGQRVDLGSHRLHPATPPQLLTLLRDLLGDDLQQRRRNGRILLGGRWVAFPLRFGDLARHLPPAFAAGALRDAIVAPVRRVRDRSDPASFVEAIDRRLGPTVTRSFYGPYARKLYGVEPDELDVELADRRIAARSRGAIVRKVLDAARGRRPVFWSPRRGYGQIVEALAAASSDVGVELVTASAVAAIRRRDTGVEVDVCGTSDVAGSRHRTVRCRAVVSTMPLSSLAVALDPAPPTTVREALDELRTRSMVLLYLVVDADRYTTFDAHYLPGAATRVSRLSEPKNYRDGADPVGRTVLCAEIPCWRDDAVWRADPDALAAEVVGELEECGLPPIGVVGAHVHRLASVYPVYERSTASARRSVEAWARDLDRVVTTGRQGLGVPDNLHHVLEMGVGAAAVVGDDGRIDARSWSSALDRFAAHVVED